MAKKLYYKIGEACKKLEIQPYVLRYWETEFPFLKPNKSKSGQRVYSDHEIDIIRRIKELLYEEGYTIAGAKKKLEGELQTTGEEADEVAVRPKKSSKRSAKNDPETAADGQSVEDVAQVERNNDVDAATAKQLEVFRLGVEVALRQTQEILDSL